MATPISAVLPDDGTLPNGHGALRGQRVLVVDDDPDTRELVETILTGVGMVVACAASVSQAFELFVSHRPTVIISDIQMPDENGHSFLRNLRSLLDEDGRMTPAIALTGCARPEDRERVLASGFNLYLTKPTTAFVLLSALQELLAH